MTSTALLLLAGLVISLAHRPRYRTEGEIRETRRRLAGVRDPRRGGWGGGEGNGGGTEDRGDIVQSILTYDDLVEKSSYDHHKEDDASKRTVEHFETNTSNTFQTVDKNEKVPVENNHILRNTEIKETHDLAKGKPAELDNYVGCPVLDYLGGLDDLLLHPTLDW